MIGTPERSARSSNGIPTPPYSETASSAGGSVGRGGQQSGETIPLRPSRRSLLPSEQKRSISASSSRTGSVTVGATSPIVNHDGISVQQHDDMQSPARRDRIRLTEDGTSSPIHSSPGSERARRSELHERDVTQLRSESRIGSRPDDDGAGDRSRDSGFHKYSPRKSTTLVKSSSYRLDDSQDSLPSRRRQPREMSDAAGVLGDRASRHAADVAGSSTTRLPRTGNGLGSSGSPMPNEFRLPDKEVRQAYRAARAEESSDSDDNAEASEDGKGFTSLEPEPAVQTQLRSTANAPSADVASHAPRSSQTSEEDALASDERARKGSTPSVRSHKYTTNSASDLHRAASRASMQKSQIRDPFSTEQGLSYPPRRSLSPSEHTERSFQTTSSGKARLFADKSPHTPSRALEDLRAQGGNMHSSSKSDSLGASSSSDYRLSSGARSSMGLRKSAIGRGFNGLTPLAPDRLQRLPMTEPPRARMVQNWISPNSGPSSDTVSRMNDLVSLRSDNDTGGGIPLRSSTSMGIVSDRIPSSPLTTRNAIDASKEPASIKNMLVRFSQLESLYGKVPTSEGAFSGAGPQTSRVLELMGAIVKGTSSMWTELARMHPIATEGHLMGISGDAATNAFGQLDEGFAFINKLTLEQARAVQDLLFLLDRMEKERQTQFNQVLQELGHSPRPFSRIGGDERASGSVSRASSTVRGVPHRLAAEDSSTGSPFARSDRGATLTSSQLRSMTSLGHTSNHMRSASELSPSSSAVLRRIHRVRPSMDTTSVSSILPPRSARDSNLFTPPSAQSALDSTAETNLAAISSRPPPSFTPRQPRLSNPSVSNATASYQPSAPSLSPDASLSGAKRSNGSGASASEAEEQGRTSQQSSGISFMGGEITPSGSRAQQHRHASTPRGETDQQAVDSLTSQLDSLGKSTISVSPTPVTNWTDRRHTMMTDLLSRADDPSERNNGTTREQQGQDPNHSATVQSPSGVAKSPKPPRPPRNAHRPSDENLSLTTGMLPFSRDVTSGDDRTGSVNAIGVQSLGRSASRRITRLLGQQGSTPQNLDE